METVNINPAFEPMEAKCRDLVTSFIEETIDRTWEGTDRLWCMSEIGKMLMMQAYGETLCCLSGVDDPQYESI